MMLFSKSTENYSLDEWQRINMRKVSHLAGAEMLHNLYNRYYPRINSIRFRHTITNFKNGTVESFAPKREWDYLKRWVSAKFIRLDKSIIDEIEEIMKTDYSFVDNLLNEINNVNLMTISNEKLALYLIDIMNIPLGDIYKLNVVQIEYGLNCAINSIMDSIESNQEDRNVLLALLISPNESTVSQIEEGYFNEIVRIGIEMKAVDPTLNEQISRMIYRHYQKYKHLNCAYGELPMLIDDFYDKYRSLYNRFFDKDASLPSPESIKSNVDKSFKKSQNKLAIIDDPKLTVLCNLLSRIGVFRDKNKAKLGETVITRFEIIDEIARRTKELRLNLNYYLVSEMVELLDYGVKVPEGNIQERKTKGVCFTRNEDFGTIPIKFSDSSVHISKKSSNVFSGVCASIGKIEAKAKVIYSRKDIKKMNAGDIMVAVGTDFDLLEIMGMAGGIITEEGGILSHASVISRELKIPCLIGVNDATKIISDGDLVILDATNNRIEVKVGKK